METTEQETLQKMIKDMKWHVDYHTQKVIEYTQQLSILKQLENGNTGSNQNN